MINMKHFYLFKILTLILFGVMSSQVYADKRNDNHFEKNIIKKIAPKGYRYDNRYRHDRYYPSTGIRYKRLPQRHYTIRYRDRPYFYSQGTWYLHNGIQFIVTAPPLGIVVPFLPPFYTTIWVRGVPYYYANDVYYTWHPDRNGYVVTEPPEDLSEEKTRPLPEELYIYPKQGQSEKKQADDRYECHSWSVSQTHYDPTKPARDSSQVDMGAKYENYQKALKACLEGRGYSVR